jgi:hypothetical protein
MRIRVFRPIATVASLLLLVTVPAQASPIKFADIVNVMGDVQKGGRIEQLRLRVAQDPNAPRSVNGTKPSADSVAPSTAGDDNLASSPLPTSTEVAPSLVAGAEVAPQQPQGDVQVFEQDNVDGTICDCGEIPTVGGGFPKWPFLALIPLICVTGICSHHHKECVDCNIQCPDCTPTPTPPVPEPTSLLLLGSGIVALSAGARRRYARRLATKQAAAVTEV